MPDTPALTATSAWDHLIESGFYEREIDPRFLAGVIPDIREGLLRMTEGPDTDAFREVELLYDEMGWSHNSGLVRRSDDEQKWFFHHYGPPTHLHLQVSGAPVHRYERFFLALTKVNARAKRLAYDLARELDRRHTCPGGPLSPRIEKNHCVTRVLRYLKRDEAKAPDATVHLDRNCITVHWYSSHPGLRIFGPDGQAHTARETAMDRIVFFTGKKFAAATRGEFGLGTPHGVKDDARHARTNDDRLALVSFVHCGLHEHDAAWLKGAKGSMDALEMSCVM